MEDLKIGDKVIYFSKAINPMYEEVLNKKGTIIGFCEEFDWCYYVSFKYKNLLLHISRKNLIKI